MAPGHDIRVDVTQAVGSGETLSVAATVWLPEDLSRGGGRTVIFGYAGGGYTREYWDLQIPGHPGYSEVEHHLRAGHIFIGCDHLAVGASDRPERQLDYDAVTRANTHAAREIIAALAGGTLIAGVAPVQIAATAALGQSFGGFLLIIAQGTEAIFDGIGVLGYSARDPQTPWPGTLSLDDVLNLRAGNGRDHPLTPTFHFPDVPDEIVIADMTKLPGTLSSGAAWSTPHNPGGPAIRSERRPRDPQAVAVEAARIESPVLVVAGEIDVVLEPALEATAYTGSPHVTTVVVPRMAHMHNFASTRVQLWQIIDDWLLAVVRHATRA
jgi:pimeloyl-ACP methyl ester carboxylesterase